jgi:hypothetical protein
MLTEGETKVNQNVVSIGINFIFYSTSHTISFFQTNSQLISSFLGPLQLHRFPIPSQLQDSKWILSASIQLVLNLGAFDLCDLGLP